MNDSERSKDFHFGPSPARTGRLERYTERLAHRRLTRNASSQPGPRTGDYGIVGQKSDAQRQTSILPRFKPLTRA